MINHSMDVYNWQKVAREVLGNEFFADFFKKETSAGPATNIYKSSSEIIVLVNLPFVRDISQIKLMVKEKELLLKGKIDLGFEHLECVQANIFSGTFETSVPLPVLVNTKRVNANYQRGILTVQLFPKLQREGTPIKIGEK